MGLLVCQNGVGLWEYSISNNSVVSSKSSTCVSLWDVNRGGTFEVRLECWQWGP